MHSGQHLIVFFYYPEKTSTKTQQPHGAQSPFATGNSGTEQN